MSLFDRIVMWQLRRGWLRQAQARTLLRLTRQYRQAWHSGEPLPSLPKPLARLWAVQVTWAAHRLSLEQPLVFVWGALCALPAAALTLYWLGVRLFALLARWGV